MKPQDIQEKFKQVDKDIQNVATANYHNVDRVERRVINDAVRISDLERLVRKIKTTIKSVSVTTILILAIIGVVSLLSGCGGTYRVVHEGNSRHDVVFTLDLYGECSQLPDNKQTQCFKTVDKLLEILAKGTGDGDDD